MKKNITPATTTARSALHCALALMAAYGPLKEMQKTTWVWRESLKKRPPSPPVIDVKFCAMGVRPRKRPRSCPRDRDAKSRGGDRDDQPADASYHEGQERE